MEDHITKLNIAILFYILNLTMYNKTSIGYNKTSIGWLIKYRYRPY